MRHDQVFHLSKLSLSIIVRLLSILMLLPIYHTILKFISLFTLAYSGFLISLWPPAVRNLFSLLNVFYMYNSCGALLTSISKLILCANS